MQNQVQEIYQNRVLRLSEQEQLQLAALIINKISHKKSESAEKKGGGIRELFGSVSLGHATGADNESIDADLGREYASTHDDE